MDYSKCTDVELKRLRKEARSYLFLSFIIIAVGFVFFILAVNETISMELGMLLFFACMIASLCCSVYLHRNKISPVDNEIFRRQQIANKQKVESVVPVSCKTMVTLIGSNARDLNMFGYGLKKGQAYYMWKANGKLNFFPAVAKVQDPTVMLKSIPLSDILFYEEIGERYHETKISGGGGRNVSIAGAVVGNAIGGTAGAVLLGNKGPKPINSRDVVHDTRAVSLRVPNRISLNFSYGDYNTFKLVIPEKDSAAIPSAAATTTSVAQMSSADEILKYKKLFDDGIISQEEFEAKKKRLLNL